MGDELGLSKEEFTIVAYDLPGFGRSKIAPNVKCDPTLAYYELAAEVGAKLMAKLGFKTYAVGGWSDGARVASLLAINHQARVDALVLWGFVPVGDKQSSYAIARTRDVSIWNPTMLENYSSVYGEHEFSELWHHYVDFTIAALESEDEELFDIREKLCAIKCPTMILHGTQDPIISYNDHIKPLKMQIYDSDITQFKGLSHNIHQADPNQFNQVLTTFVTSLRA